MADIDFLSIMKRSEKRAVANSLRRVQKCLNCNLFGTCYKENQRVMTIRANHKGNGFLPKDARDSPVICEYHEGRNEKGKFYPNYDMNK